MRFNHFVKLSGALFLTTALAGTASANNYNSNGQGFNAHEACKASEDRRQIIGGGIGVVAGAVIGSQVSGSGARTEGSVLGGVLGGLAGAGIADKTIDCDPVYEDSGYENNGYQNSGYNEGGYNTSSSGTYTVPTTTTYGSSQTYGTTQSSGYHQTASYPQEQYGTRTIVSDHPVYQNPTYGAQTGRTVISQPVSQPVYSQPALLTASRDIKRPVIVSRAL